MALSLTPGSPSHSSALTTQLRSPIPSHSTGLGTCGNPNAVGNERQPQTSGQSPGTNTSPIPPSLVGSSPRLNRSPDGKASPRHPLSKRRVEPRATRTPPTSRKVPRFRPPLGLRRQAAGCVAPWRILRRGQLAGPNPGSETMSGEPTKMESLQVVTRAAHICARPAVHSHHRHVTTRGVHSVPFNLL